ncbi:unnamed protein product [Scytosiphon promiscuus]
MRLVFLAGALAILCCKEADSTTRHTGHVGGGAFVNGGWTAVSKKRPRGTRPGERRAKTAAIEAATAAPAGAVAGSFTAARCGRCEGVWFTGTKTGRIRGWAGAGAGGQGHPRMLFGLQFQPPEFSVFLHGTVQAIMLGAFAAIIPKVTAERIREKEEGLALDEAYEAGLLDDDDDDDEFGYAGGYVCPTCDNSNEVECTQCGGKGFFVSASAMPKKCDYCSGLGTFPCQECEERRERLRRERASRMPPRELPPARGEDFPFGR